MNKDQRHQDQVPTKTGALFGHGVQQIARTVPCVLRWHDLDASGRWRKNRNFPSNRINAHYCFGRYVQYEGGRCVVPAGIVPDRIESQRTLKAYPTRLKNLAIGYQAPSVSVDG